MNKVNRNDPCPCGSGKKYKKCCMLNQALEKLEGFATRDEGSDISTDENPDQHKPSARAAEIENNFRRACNYMDRNEFEQASKIFRSVILLDRKHYKALTGLGRCLVEMGMREEACEYFEKALEINPNYAQASINLKLNRK